MLASAWGRREVVALAADDEIRLAGVNRRAYRHDVHHSVLHELLLHRSQSEAAVDRLRKEAVEQISNVLKFLNSGRDSN